VSCVTIFLRRGRFFFLQWDPFLFFTCGVLATFSIPIFPSVFRFDALTLGSLPPPLVFFALPAMSDGFHVVSLFLGLLHRGEDPHVCHFFFFFPLGRRTLTPIFVFFRLAHESFPLNVCPPFPRLSESNVHLPDRSFSPP